MVPRQAAKVSKLLVSSLLLPASRIVAERGYKDSGKVIGKLATLLPS